MITLHISYAIHILIQRLSPGRGSSRTAAALSMVPLQLNGYNPNLSSLGFVPARNRLLVCDPVTSAFGLGVEVEVIASPVTRIRPDEPAAVPPKLG